MDKKEILCGVNPETARGLAYDLLNWAREMDKKFKHKKLTQ